MLAKNLYVTVLVGEKKAVLVGTEPIWSIESGLPEKKHKKGTLVVSQLAPMGII